MSTGPSGPQQPLDARRPPRLSLTLSPPWELLDPARLPLDAVGQALHVHLASKGRPIPWQVPGLVARMGCVISNAEGAFAGVLMASMSATAVPSRPDTRNGLRRTLLRDVEVAPGVPADYAVLEYTRTVNADAHVVLDFASPNLPLLHELERAFVVIADSARID